MTGTAEAREEEAAVEGGEAPIGLETAGPGLLGIGAGATEGSTATSRAGTPAAAARKGPAFEAAPPWRFAPGPRLALAPESALKTALLLTIAALLPRSTSSSDGMSTASSPSALKSRAKPLGNH